MSRQVSSTVEHELLRKDVFIEDNNDTTTSPNFDEDNKTSNELIKEANCISGVVLTDDFVFHKDFETHKSDSSIKIQLEKLRDDTFEFYDDKNIEIVNEIIDKKQVRFKYDTRDTLSKKHDELENDSNIDN